MVINMISLHGTELNSGAGHSHSYSIIQSRSFMLEILRHCLEMTSIV